MRTVPVLLLAVCLALSGCSFLGGPASPTAGPGPGPGGETPTGTPDPAATISPPGIEDGRLTDVGVLLDTHEAALLGTGFETDLRANATNSFQGELYESRQRQQTIVEPEAAEYRFRTTSLTDGFVANNWGNQSTTVIRARLGNTTQYQIRGATEDRLLTSRPILADYLNATPMTVVGTAETRDGDPVVRLANDGSPDPENLDSDVVPRNATDVRNWTVTAAVDEQGRILEFRATADYTLQGEQGSLEVTFDVLRLDGDVEQPDWVTRAFEAAESQSS